MAVLGQFAAHIEMPVPVEEDLVVIGWPIIGPADDPGADVGRKHRCGSALFDAEGQQVWGATKGGYVFRKSEAR